MHTETRAWMAIGIWLGAAAAWADQPPKSDMPAETSFPAHLIVVSARAVERPLMKYRLLPAEYELHDGNAAPILLRFPWEHTQYFAKEVPKFSKYLILPLSDQKMRSPEELFNPVFYRELKRAAYRRTADWQYPIGEEPAMNILLPDVQGGRQIAGWGLSVWIRQRLARGDLEGAREGILVGLAVSRHYGRTPFIVNQLVQSSDVEMMLERLDELLQMPGCPNLYWALAALPRPYVDLKPSFELQERMLEMTVPGLDDLDHPRSEEQWSEIARELVQIFRQFGTIDNKNGPVTVEHIVKQARAELPAWVKGGADQVAHMTDTEAAVRWFVRSNRDLSQEMTALASLSPPMAIPKFKAFRERTRALRSEASLNISGWNFFDTYVRVHRIDRTIDALRVIEAIRNYAASHQSQLPTSLDKIVDTPVPDDPFTGKPFQYEAKVASASLSAPGVDVEGKELAAIHYRITIRK